MKIDAMGLACPEPVIRTKQAVEQKNPENLTILVDNPAARENVNRFLESQGYMTTLEQKEDQYFIHGARDKAPQRSKPAKPAHNKESILVYCPETCMGKGDDLLGEKLMISFISTLKEMGDDLWRIAFVNSGVKLTIKGSPVLEALRDLEKQGVSILVCGTCLTHFDLLEQKEVGETTNMLDIVTSLQVADKVVRV